VRIHVGARREARVASFEQQRCVAGEIHVFELRRQELALDYEGDCGALLWWQEDIERCVALRVEIA